MEKQQVVNGQAMSMGQQGGNQAPNGGNTIVIMMPQNESRDCSQNTKYNNHSGSLRDWHYGMCTCCADCDSCCEAWWCTPCQLSRQCNMIQNNLPTISCCYCLLFTFINPCMLELPMCCGAMQMRSTVRARYGIDGNCCGDCCGAFWCLPCVVQQVLLEMTSMNEFPGACCYSAVQAPRVL